MYKGMRFQKRAVAEVKQDIEVAARLYGDARCAFIGDADSIIIPVDDFVAILEHLYLCFPHLRRVTSYGRAKTVLKKPVEDLRKLSEAGLSRLHLGLESGDDETLSAVVKGITGAEAVKAGLKVKEAGISLSEYVLLGLGGSDGFMRHAQQTAAVLNKIDPDFIRVRTLTVVPGTPLASKLDEGTFTPCSPLELLQEERRLIELLDGINSTFTSDHVSNLLPLHGELPRDKEDMLRALDEAIRLVETGGWEPHRVISRL
jgi:radical SAM superfamily enzyme YgiQ (UPF0313 family)